MFRSGSSGAGLEESTAVQQRNDRKHFGARADFKNWEQISEIVTQDVARDRNRIFAFLDPLEREPRGLCRGHDPDVESIGIVIFQITLNLLDEFRIVGAGL